MYTIVHLSLFKRKGCTYILWPPGIVLNDASPFAFRKLPRVDIIPSQKIHIIMFCVLVIMAVLAYLGLSIPCIVGLLVTFGILIYLDFVSIFSDL